MSIKLYDKSGGTPQEVLLAGIPATDLILNGTSKNPIANKTVYNALATKIESTVENLVNFYNKSQVYNKQEVRDLIGAINTLTIEVVNELPTQDISATTIYFLKQSGANTYDEYIYVDNAWVKIGDTDIDLSGYLTTANFQIAIADYYTKSAIDAMIANYYTKTQVDAMVDAKQDALTFDSAPTQGSANPVQSGGTFNAIKAVSDDVDELSSQMQALTNQVDDISDEIADMNNVLGAKNLLPFPYYDTSKTASGITWTVNSDGSISVSGTATADSFFRLTKDSDLSIYNNTILSGCPANGGMWTKWALYLSGTKDEQSVLKYDIGSGVLIEDIPAGYSGGIYAKIINGQTVNFTFYPMFRLTSITDDTYVPYSMTNKQLTDCVAKNYSFSVSFDGEKTVRDVLNELETMIENYITNNPSRLLVVLNIRSFALDMNCPVGITSNNIPGGFAFGGAMYMSNGANKIHAGSIKTSNSQLKYSIGDAVTDLTLTKPTSGSIQARCILF